MKEIEPEAEVIALCFCFWLLPLLGDVWSTLRTWSIGGIAVTNFKQELGPYLQTYASNGKTAFISKLQGDPSLTAELTVIGKHAKQCVTREGDRVLIQPYGKGRAKYVVIELQGKEHNKAQRLLTILAENLKEGTSEEVRRIVKEEVKT